MLLAFSPRLLRSTVALTIDAFKPGTVVGRASLRSLAQLATGATTLYVLTGLALGKDWDEIKTGLNPLNGKRFLSHQINGDWIGVGGQVRAIAQLIAGAMIDPVSLSSLDRFENPLLRFAGGRGAPILGVLEATAEAVTGRDFAPFDEIDGPLDLAKHVAKSTLPFAAQGIIEGEGLAAVLTGLAGARTSAETPFDKRNAARDRSKARLIQSGDIPPSTADQVFRRFDRNIGLPLSLVVPTDKTEELDLDVQRLIDEDPEVRAAKAEVDELQTKRRRPIQLMTNALDKIDKTQNNLIAEAADQLGPGRAFREIYSVHQRDRSRDKDAERTRHPEAIQAIEEFEPSEAAFQVALSAYMEALNDPRLENAATGEYDFDLRDSLLDGVRSDHPGMINRIETFIRDDSELRAVSPEAADMVRQLRENRETLRPYWDQIDVVVSQQNPEFQAIYRGFQELSPRDQVKIISPLAGDSVEVRGLKERNRLVINDVNTKINDLLERMRLSDSAIRDALIRWEYDVSKQLIQIQSIEEASGGLP